MLVGPERVTIRPLRLVLPLLAALALVAAVLMGVASFPSPAIAESDEDAFASVTDEMLRNPDPADWLMWRRTLDSWGYSPLAEINGGNVGFLRLVWSRGLVAGAQEGTPLVHDGIMYFPNPHDVIQAIDARTGDLLWEHRRDLPADLEQYVNAPYINRSLAIYGDLIIGTSADGHVYALDARTGKAVWDSEIIDYKTGVHQTSGPIVAGGKVISGRACDPNEFASPAPCVVTAHDAITGRELWRTRTIPAPGEPGNETWGDVPFDERKHVGTWIAPSYDPELDLVIIGTSVTAPAPKYLLGGNDKKHLYHNATLALDAETGEIVWHYQHLVDHWDLDHPFERLLIETEVAPDKAAVPWINPAVTPGERRKVITGIPGKTGVVYTLDRETGAFLWARPTVRQTVLADIDVRTGEATVNPETVFSGAGDEAFVCPGTDGGKNWPAGAYSPLTHAMYYPLQNTCARITAVAETRAEASVYGTRGRKEIAPGTRNVGTIHALSVATGETLWKHEQRAASLSLLATGGGLLFGGDVNGRFRAFDQESGAVLWEVNLGSPVTGFPIAFAVDGRQYIAVSVGQAPAVGGYLSLTPELHPSTTNNLFVFALPVGWETEAPGESRKNSGKARSASSADRALIGSSTTSQGCTLSEGKVEAVRTAWNGVYAATQAARGKELYDEQCALCHGESMQGTHSAPSLAGSGFRVTWNGQTAGTLFDCLRNTMPPGQGGSLTDQGYIDILAAILAANGFPAADNDDALPSDPAELDETAITRKP